MRKLDTMDEYKDYIIYGLAALGLLVWPKLQRGLLKLLGGHPEWKQLEGKIDTLTDNVDELTSEFRDHVNETTRTDARLNGAIDRLEIIERDR